MSIELVTPLFAIRFAFFLSVSVNYITSGGCRLLILLKFVGYTSNITHGLTKSACGQLVSQCMWEYKTKKEATWLADTWCRGKGRGRTCQGMKKLALNIRIDKVNSRTCMMTKNKEELMKKSKRLQWFWVKTLLWRWWTHEHDSKYWISVINNWSYRTVITNTSSVKLSL